MKFDNGENNNENNKNKFLVFSLFIKFLSQKEKYRGIISLGKYEQQNGRRSVEMYQRDQ